MINLKIEVSKINNSVTASGAILGLIKKEVVKMTPDVNIKSLLVKIEKLEEQLDEIDNAVDSIKKLIG